MMKPVVLKEHVQGKHLQQHKCQKGEVPPNEKKNITHLRIGLYALSHNEWIAIIVFQSQSCATNHTLQWIIGNMHG
jgi:hypothetical protein